MKDKRIFETINFLNFFCASAFVAIALYFTFRQSATVDNTVALTAFLSLYFLVALPFNWQCFLLYKARKYGRQLSKKAKIAGDIFYILFFLLTLLEIYGFTDIITDIKGEKGIFRDTRFMLFFSLFSSIVITSFYLCIFYWIVRKRVKTQLTDVVAELGADVQ